MGRKFVHDYTFDPANQIVKIKGYVAREKLLMITNVTVGKVIQQFASSSEGITTYSYNQASTEIDSVDGVTTVELVDPCTGMSSTDDLQIIVEEEYVSTRPFPFGTDAIERTRTSSPESLIDADFEYGLQSTKWASFTSTGNYPGIYELPGQEIVVSNVSTNNTSPYSTITVLANGHSLANGDAITIFGLENDPPTASRAEGAFLITTTSTNTFTYFAKGYVGPNTSVELATPVTQLRKAGFYQYSSIAYSNNYSSAANPSVITVNTSQPHGLLPGHNLIIDVTSSGTNHTLAEGNFFVEQVPTSNSFVFTARTGGAIANNGTLNLTVRARSDGFNIHRPFDGGVLIGPDSPAHGSRVLRQSKKYFRYQSGKGILYSSGTLLQPNYDVERVTASGTSIGATISITTEQSHGLQSGAGITLSGVSTSGFNGSYTVGTIVSDNEFSVTATSAPGATTASLGDQPRVSVNSWHGSSIRAGMYDDQNGVFWESDGQRIYVVKRSSTFQLSGTVSVSNGSSIVTGTNTRFSEQLDPDDRVVIRGQSKRIIAIANNTTMYIAPFFSASGLTTVSGLKIAKTVDTRIPQEDFNTDKINGSGPSGFTFLPNKMQMLGIQYSWYGAGFIDFMLRGRDGNFVYVHRIKNNNVNDEAYLRSGNLPARYEITNETPTTYMTVEANTSVTTLTVANTYFFPSTGTLYAGNELISYTGKTANTFTGCTRATNIQQFVGGSNRTFTAGVAETLPVNRGVVLISCTCSPTLSHWGSSVIMDGGFNLDRGYFFNYAATNQSVNAAATKTIFLMRLAPTVSNSLAGNFGTRELINRSLILLQKMEIISNTNIVVQGTLNPAGLSGITWRNINTSALGSQPSFVQISSTFTGTAAPGEQIFSTVASAAGGLTTVDLSQLKELGNGVVGGDSQYPDGPDVLAITVRNLAVGTANVNINLFWTETQA